MSFSEKDLRVRFEAFSQGEGALIVNSLRDQQNLRINSDWTIDSPSESAPLFTESYGFTTKKGDEWQLLIPNNHDMAFTRSDVVAPDLSRVIAKLSKRQFNYPFAESEANHREVINFLAANWPDLVKIVKVLKSEQKLVTPAFFPEVDIDSGRADGVGIFEDGTGAVFEVGVKGKFGQVTDYSDTMNNHPDFKGVAFTPYVVHYSFNGVKRLILKARDPIKLQAERARKKIA